MPTCASEVVGCCCVTTPCCPGKVLPPQLVFVISGSGGCDGSYIIKYNPAELEWESFSAIGGCPGTTPPLTTLAVFCRPNEEDTDCVWGFSVENDFVGFMTVISCDPLHLRYFGFGNLVPCGCLGTPTADVFQL